jgi:hypothetical protein
MNLYIYNVYRCTVYRDIITVFIYQQTHFKSVIENINISIKISIKIASNETCRSSFNINLNINFNVF